MSRLTIGLVLASWVLIASGLALAEKRTAVDPQQAAAVVEQDRKQSKARTDATAAQVKQRNEASSNANTEGLFEGGDAQSAAQESAKKPGESKN